jgi:hypothetical protein
MRKEKSDQAIIQRVLINEKSQEDLIRELENQDPDKIDYQYIVD